MPFWKRDKQRYLLDLNGVQTAWGWKQKPQFFFFHHHNITVFVESVGSNGGGNCQLFPPTLGRVLKC